jgi:sec-independent protein translocase protein TatB
MFDIGFSEIVVIGVVALVVIGPERLPKTARTAGLLFGRLQRYVNDVKADISREMEFDELRRMQREVQGAAREFEQTMKTTANDVASGLRNVEHELNAAAAGTTASAPPDTAPATPLPSPSAAVPPAADVEPPRQAPLPGFDRI